MSRKALTIGGVGIVAVALITAFYWEDLFPPRDPFVEMKKGELQDQAANAANLIERSHVPGFWIAALERDPIVLSGTVSEIDKATVQEVIFKTQKTQRQSFDVLKAFFAKEGWTIGTDDYPLGKLSFSKDSVGQIVFVLIEPVANSNELHAQVSLKRIIAHE